MVMAAMLDRDIVMETAAQPAKGVGRIGRPAHGTGGSSNGGRDSKPTTAQIAGHKLREPLMMANGPGNGHGLMSKNTLTTEPAETTSVTSRGRQQPRYLRKKDQTIRTPGDRFLAGN